MKFLPVLVLALAALPFSAQGEDLLRDDFKEERPDFWEPMPATADFSEGYLKLATTSGQSTVVSLQEFEDSQLTIKFSVSEIGANNSIFFYFGYQTVQPWMGESFVSMIQDSALVIGASRNGAQTDTFTVPNLSIQAEREYELVMRREKGSVEVILDGGSVHRMDDAKKVPTGPLFVFFAVNSFKENKEPVVLSVKSVVVEPL